MKKTVSRKQFLQQMAWLSGGVAWGMGSMTGKAYAQMPAAFASAAGSLRGKAVVIIQLNGGNDGLNTVLPIDQYGQYYNARTNIAIPESSILKLNNYDATGLHPSMTGLQSLFNDGKLNIVQSVGYPQPNYSHFRATDIWFTGSGSTQSLDSGWLGRALDIKYPNFPLDT